jgi:hypothetical protein
VPKRTWIDEEQGLKLCRFCDTVKPFAEFGRHPNCHLGIANKCKPCMKEFNRKNAWLRHGINITVEQFDAMLKRQRSRCAICGVKQDGRSLDVDHDHVTGQVRGLLCRPCNMTIVPMAERLVDDVVVRSALRYLESHRQLSLF